MVNRRREFIKLAPLAMGSVASVSASDGWIGDERESLLGAWKSVHTLPFPPGSFREFLSFAEGGVVHETNAFLNTNSNLDFSMYGLPSVLNASDGVGTWKRMRHGDGTDVTFRKLLFDGSRQNFGDLLVNGTVKTSRDQLTAEWHIQVVDLSDQVLADLGSATSAGSRIK